MRGAHSAKKPKKAKDKTKKKAKKTGAVLKVDPDIIKSTMAPKVQEPVAQDAKKQAPAAQTPKSGKNKHAKKKPAKASRKQDASKQGSKKRTGLLVVCIFILLALGVAIFFVVSQRADAPAGTSGSLMNTESAQVTAIEDDLLDEQTDEAEQEENKLSGMVDDVDSPTRYTSSHFGFTVGIPEGFSIDSEFDNGDGVILVNDELNMIVNVSGSNNVEGLDAQAVLESLWNKKDDSIRRAEDNRVIIYQYDDTSEYFYWVFIGPGSINQMKIEYPLKDNNRVELETAQALMQGFMPGDLNRTH